MRKQLIQAFCKYANNKERAVSLQQVEHLMNIGALCEKTALYFVVKNEYYEIQKEGTASGRDTKMFLSIKWDIPEPTIHKVIYLRDEIKA